MAGRRGREDESKRGAGESVKERRDEDENARPGVSVVPRVYTRCDPRRHRTRDGVTSIDEARLWERESSARREPLMPVRLTALLGLGRWSDGLLY